MLSDNQIEALRDSLTTKCGNVTYTPQLYLRNETIPQLVIVYIIFNKRYNFTLPMYIFENAIYLEEYEKVQKDLINEIIRNVELAHKREERILL